MDDSRKTYYIEINGSKAYFQYDEEKQEFYPRNGKSVIIGKDRFEDFLHTAKVLGFKAGEL